LQSLCHRLARLRRVRCNEQDRHTLSAKRQGLHWAYAQSWFRFDDGCNPYRAKQNAVPHTTESKRVKEMKGLYANINAKKARIKAGSDEKMRKPGAKGAPTAAAFKASAKTAKKPK